MDSFSTLKCIELGKFLLSSGLLDISLSKISELQQSSYQNKDSGLEFETYEEAKFTFVVFATPPTSRNGSCDSASTLVPGLESQDPNPFQFLCSKKTPSFSLHTSTFELFASAKEKLSELKSKLLESEEPVIITGAALGGAVASLFTLWLLETISPRRRLLCITFDSPFIGDAKLQQILENSVSSSCFLHVVDAAKASMAADFFKPFGTFYIKLDSEGVCIEDAEAVMEMLVCWRDYGEGLDQSSMAESKLKIDGIINRMKERGERKKQRFDPFKKLDPMKILMMYIEWYKKKSKMAKIGYYDQYRSEIPTTDDIKVETWKKELNAFWTSVVEDADKKPQIQSDKILKRRFLFAGNNYRRLIEPLDIAEYYRKGGKEYQTSVEGRSRHYDMLEKWFGQQSLEAERSKDRELSDLLTFDSCFWSNVEDAMIVIKSLKTHEGMRDEVSIGKLVRFEEYVWEMIRKREVSPEIFLEKSSFMRWWKEYKVMKERDEFLSSTSEFTEFMDTRKYKSYGKPESNSRA